MDNMARAENVATTDPIFSNELKAKVIETEEYMEAHPDEWITSEDFFDALREIIDE